jgi:hydroxymethylglutaryl-CoA reductase
MTKNVINSKTEKLIEKIEKDIKENKNLSPIFSNFEDFINYLDDKTIKL